MANKTNKANKASQVRYGVFYRSNGRWTTTPYKGVTFTAYQATRNPIKARISSLKNFVLKSRVRVRPVVTAK